MEKFEFDEYMISRKFYGKLWTLDLQMVQIREKIDFVQCIVLSKFNWKLRTFDGHIFQIHGKIRIR